MGQICTVFMFQHHPFVIVYITICLFTILALENYPVFSNTYTLGKNLLMDYKRANAAKRDHFKIVPFKASAKVICFCLKNVGLGQQ